MEIDETQLNNWRTELAQQRFEGAFLTRSQAFATKQLVALVAAASSQIPDMLPYAPLATPEHPSVQNEADLQAASEDGEAAVEIEKEEPPQTPRKPRATTSTSKSKK